MEKHGDLYFGRAQFEVFRQRYFFLGALFERKRNSDFIVEFQTTLRGKKNKTKTHGCRINI